MADIQKALNLIEQTLRDKPCTCTEGEWPYNCWRCADLNRLRSITLDLGYRLLSEQTVTAHDTKGTK